MKRPLSFLLAALLLGVVVAGGLWWRWYNSPRYALHQMVLALQTKNYQNFFKYLDLVAITDNLTEAGGQDLSQGAEPKDDWERLGRKLGQKMAKMVLPKLMESFQGQIQAAVEQYLQNLTSTQVLALAGAVTAAEVSVQGEEAVVTLKDPKTKDTLRLRMARNPQDGNWRIVAVNYNDLKKMVKRELQ
jgi:hypothetical protein